MNPEIAQIEQQIKNYSISNLDELESFRLQFLSKKGSIQELFKLMGTIPNQEKAAFGKSLNELKKLAQDTFDQAKEAQHSTQTARAQSPHFAATPSRPVSTPEFQLIGVGGGA